MRRCSLMVGLVLVLVGCSQLPTEGPVTQVSHTAAAREYPGVAIAPAPPVPGGSPELILAGFLSAVSSTSANRFTVARQYLSPGVAQTWDPLLGVTVYDGEGHPPIVSDTSAVLQASVVGRLSAESHYQSVQEPEFSHNFGMTKVNDEWRISLPGQGIWVSQSQFKRTFRKLPVYFLDRSGEHVVGQNVYLSVADATPTMAVQSLLRGPSAWLRPAVLTALPAEAKLRVSSVPVDAEGIAQVSFTEHVNALSSGQRLQLAAQLLWTLNSFPEINGVVITVNGAPFTVPGQDTQGVLRTAGVRQFQPMPPSVNGSYGLQANKVVSLPRGPDATPVPVSGQLGVTGEVSFASLAVSVDGSTAAVVAADRSRMWTAPLDSGDLTLRVEGVGLTRPQIDAAGSIWVIQQGIDGAPHLIRIGYDGTKDEALLAELRGRDVVAFRISPDRTRVAVVVRQADTAELGVLRLRSTDRLVADGWRPLTMHTTGGVLTDVRDVGWAADSILVVLGATAEVPQQSVYVSDVEGADIGSLGPNSDVDAVSLAVQPRSEGFSAMLLTASGRALRYEDRSRWVPFTEQMAALAHAG